MDNFIVWYSNDEDMFSKEFTLDELISQLHLEEINDSPLLKDYKVIEIQNATGLNDINNKKIYQCSSIVSAIFADEIKVKGYFIFDDKNLRYFFAFIDVRHIIVNEFIEHYNKLGGIDCIDGLVFRTMEYSSDLFSHIKIIDTIQENKLGLLDE